MRYMTLQAQFKLVHSIYEIKNLYVQQEASQVTFGVDFDILLNVHDVTYYVNNLNTLYIYLIDYLAKKNIPFEYSYKNGKCANIKLSKANVFFVNFKSKFGVDFDEENNNNNWMLINYALEHNRVRLSLGADAYNEFLLTIFRPKDEPNANHALMRECFPIWEYDDMLLEAKANAYGFQYVKAGWYNKAFDYDISSSYPASALEDMPCGLPYYYDRLEDVPTTYFKVIKFTYYNCKCKPNGIDFLNVSHMGTISLSQGVFEEFKRNYNASIKIVKIEAFRTRKSLFREFIHKTIIAGKLDQKNNRIGAYNKYIGNAIIGYLGRNTDTITNTAKLTPQGLQFSEEIKHIDPIYLPAHIAILDASKARFLRTLRPIFKKVIYANTDGFITNEPISLDWLNIGISNEILGKFRFQNEYNTLYIESLNGYAGITTDGTIENTISGMSIGHTLTPQQFAEKSFTYYINEPTPDGHIRCRTIKQRR